MKRNKIFTEKISDFMAFYCTSLLAEEFSSIYFQDKNLFWRFAKCFVYIFQGVFLFLTLKKKSFKFIVFLPFFCCTGHQCYLQKDTVEQTLRIKGKQRSTLIWKRFFFTSTSLASSSRVFKCLLWWSRVF